MGTCPGIDTFISLIYAYVRDRLVVLKKKAASARENSAAASVWRPQDRLYNSSDTYEASRRSHIGGPRGAEPVRSMRGGLASWLARDRTLTLVRGIRRASAGLFAIDDGSDSSSAPSTPPSSSGGRDSIRSRAGRTSERRKEKNDRNPIDPLAELSRTQGTRYFPVLVR